MFNIEGNSNYKVYIDDGYVVKKSSNKSKTYITKRRVRTKITH